MALAAAVTAAGLPGCAGNSGTTNIGTITTVAGDGVGGYSGNGGPATSARLTQPTCVVEDGAGNLYIGDIDTNTVRKVAAGTGIISAYAGNGTQGYSGDGGPAIAATLYAPSACAIDAAGNLYVSERGNNVVRKVAASTGIITTVAGTGYGAGCAGGDFSGDGGPATKAHLFCPSGVAVDAAGDLFISDANNQRVREVNAATGVITTIAGNGTYGYSGNGGAATSAMIGNPAQLAFDPSGENLYIAEATVVEKLNLSSGVIITVAGNGTPSDGSQVVGDGGLATQAELAVPLGVALDAAGNIYVADSGDNRVRIVSATTGIITTAAGTSPGYSGDGGPATGAQLHNPWGLFVDASGNLYISDSYNSAIRKVTP